MNKLNNKKKYNCLAWYYKNQNKKIKVQLKKINN